MSHPGAVDLTPSYLRAADELRNNEGQWQVYEHQGNCVALAGPGSGKTKTLTIKMAKILSEDVKYPQGVACITYNAECAGELKRRLERLGVTGRRNVFIGTVHSFCLKNVLLPYGKIAGLNLPDLIKVAPPSVQKALFEKALSETIGINEHPGNWKIRFDQYRRTYVDRNLEEFKNTEPDVARLIEAYESLLRSEGLIDFDDMVLWGLYLVENFEWVRKLIKARFPVLIVDEYQDLGLSLHRIVLSLCCKAGVRLLAVGDPDQSIYGFTGANPELLRQLSQMENMAEVYLRVNYRCGSTIVEASEIALGEERGYITPDGAHSGTIDFYEFSEGLAEQANKICIEIIPSVTERLGCNIGDIAVLYLDKNDGDIIARAVLEQDMDSIRIDQNAPYNRTPFIRWLEECALWCSDGWRTGHPQLSAIIQTWLNFNKDIDDERLRLLKKYLIRFLRENRTQDAYLRDWLSAFKAQCLEVVLANPEFTDENEAFRKLMSACNEAGKISSFTVAAFGGQGGSPNHLNLMTLHSSKGLEFKAVIMMGMDQGKIPWVRTTPKHKAEHRRLFYVGVTRAKQELHITYSGWVGDKYGRRHYNGPSQFVQELYSNLRD